LPSQQLIVFGPVVFAPVYQLMAAANKGEGDRENKQKHKAVTNMKALPFGLSSSISFTAPVRCFTSLGRQLVGVQSAMVGCL
jgi:hypothetical protein